MATNKQKAKKQQGSIPANVFPSEKARTQIGIAAAKANINFSDMLDEIIDYVGTTPRVLKEVLNAIEK